MKNYTIENVMYNLKSKGCDIKGMTIDISNPYKNERLGNKSWGQIRFSYKTGSKSFRILSLK